MTEYEMKKKDPVNVNLFLDLCGTCSQYSNDALFDGDGDTGKLDADSLDRLVNIAYNT
jgi:hypothetical protein